MDHTCGNCKAFDQDDICDTGECRLHPPLVVPDFKEAYFPNVSKLHWCLDWVPKEVAPRIPRGERQGKRAITGEDTFTQAHYELSRKLGLDVAQQFAAFRSYCKAHDKRYSDWSAAFRNWLTSPLQQKGKV